MNIISRLKTRKQNPDYRKYGDREYYVRFLGYNWVEEIIEIGLYHIVVKYKGNVIYDKISDVVETRFVIEDHMKINKIK